VAAFGGVMVIWHALAMADRTASTPTGGITGGSAATTCFAISEPLIEVAPFGTVNDPTVIEDNAGLNAATSGGPTTGVAPSPASCGASTVLAVTTRRSPGLACTAVLQPSSGMSVGAAPCTARPQHREAGGAHGDQPRDGYCPTTRTTHTALLNSPMVRRDTSWHVR